MPEIVIPHQSLGQPGEEFPLPPGLDNVAVEMSWQLKEGTKSTNFDSTVRGEE